MRRLLALLLLLAACVPAPAQERWYRVGITPFNYGISDETQDDVYARINPRQDVMSHHVDDGVPWPEAYAGTPFHPAVEANIARRLDSTPTGTPIYLAVTPLNGGRTELAGYWNDESNAPRPGIWADKDFDDPMVLEAYLNYCREMIDRFQPAYFNYAIESTELAHNNPDAWSKFMVLVRGVYPVLKREYPGLPIFASAVIRHPDSRAMADEEPFIREMMQYSDWMGVSTYPYLWFESSDPGDPANLPPDWLSQVVALAPGKPVAVAETGWLAETLDVPEYGIYVVGTAQRQQDYLIELFAQLDALQARHVTWFLAVDYDQAWAIWELLGLDPALSVWKDTGLWSGDLVARPSLATWDTRFAASYITAPPPVPGDRATASGNPLRVDKASASALTVQWDATTCPAAGYHLVWYDLDALAAYPIVAEDCAVGISGSWSGAAPAGNVALIVVADDGAAVEGSHGVDAAGFERGSASAVCGHTIKLADGACP